MVRECARRFNSGNGEVQHMVMRNKRGLIKTLEAILAVVILLGAVLVFVKEDPKEELTVESVKQAQKFILREISLNETFRSCITGNPAYAGACTGGCRDDIAMFVSQSTPAGFVSECEICDKAISCVSLNLPVDRSIFADSVLVSDHPVSKVVRVYFFEREQ